MKYLIGVVGESGSGKGTFSSILTEIAKDKVSVIKFSDILFKTLKMWYIPATRTNLQNLAVVMVRQFGKGALTNAIRQHVKKQTREIVVLEGVRWVSDVEMIKSFADNKLVYITAASRVRFTRMRVRGEKVGENAKTYKQFLSEEKAKTEINIKQIGKSADVKFVNNGDLKELRMQIRKFYNSLNTDR